MPADESYWATLSREFAAELPRIEEIAASLPELSAEEFGRLRYLIHGTTEAKAASPPDARGEAA